MLSRSVMPLMVTMPRSSHLQYAHVDLYMSSFCTQAPSWAKQLPRPRCTRDHKDVELRLILHVYKIANIAFEAHLGLKVGDYPLSFIRRPKIHARVSIFPRSCGIYEKSRPQHLSIKSLLEIR